MRAIPWLFGFICSFGLHAQGTWLSAHIGGAHATYVPFASADVTARTVDPQFGLRFGQDIGRTFRFTIGLFMAYERYDMRTEEPGVTRAISVRTDYVSVPVLGSFQLSATGRHEWRVLAGVVFQAPQRIRGDAGSGEQEMDADTRTGLSGRMGARYAHALNGRLWLSCEAFAEIPFMQDHEQSAYHYPPVNALNIPDKAATFGLLLGVELGPRKADR